MIDRTQYPGRISTPSINVDGKLVDSISRDIRDMIEGRQRRQFVAPRVTIKDRFKAMRRRLAFWIYPEVYDEIG